MPLSLWSFAFEKGFLIRGTLFEDSSDLSMLEDAYWLLRMFATFFIHLHSYLNRPCQYSTVIGHSFISNAHVLILYTPINFEILYLH
jgi:hypothetical protein